MCSPCLTAIRSENGRQRASGQAPDIGARKQRAFRGRPYCVVYMPDHPDAPRGGWMMEHRLVVEGEIGRRLTAAEVVHHIDDNGLNNDPANLELIESKGRHLAEHHSADGVAARLASYPACGKCGRRTAHGSDECWSCWRKSQTCPTCGRPERKMARRDMCHGCYKRHCQSRPVDATLNPPNSDAC